jgi:hypothetical protein
MYAEGRGVVQDHQEAARWYRAAAEQNDATAQSNLGWMYWQALGVPQDHAEAAMWYQRAAEQNEPIAQCNLGWMYREGIGVHRDDAEAVKWLRLAAEQDQPRAQNNLGLMYEQGRGVPQDDAKAFEWYRKAADQEDSLAQANLGMMYLKGRGVAPCEWQASALFSLAAHQGCEQATTNLALLDKFHFLTHVQNALAAVVVMGIVVFGSLIAFRMVRTLVRKGEGRPTAGAWHDNALDDRRIHHEDGSHRPSEVSTQRMIACTMLLAVGLAAAAVGFQQLSRFEAYIGDKNATWLCFFGITLFCTGAFCPFRRTVSGVSAGIILSGLVLSYCLS